LALLEHYYFPKAKIKIRTYINLCRVCKKAKYDRRPYKIEFADTPLPRKPFDVLHLDIFIAQPSMFISAVDKLSKFGTLIPIKSRTIPDVRRSLLKLISTYGSPKLIVCDNEPSIKSIEVRGLMEGLGIEMYFAPSNHSEVNGIVERFHSTLAEIFRCIKHKHEGLSQTEIFKLALIHYNATIHSVTKMKPRELFFGIRENEERPLNLDLIIENRDRVFDKVIEELKKNQEKSLEYHNRDREKEPEFLDDETVFLKRQGVKSKTQPKFQNVKVTQNRRKTFVDSTGRKLHKANVKRRN